MLHKLRTLRRLAQAQETTNPISSSSGDDDIGYWNISAYNQGMKGYKTPNIDRIGEGRPLSGDEELVDKDVHPVGDTKPAKQEMKPMSPCRGSYFSR